MWMQVNQTQAISVKSAAKINEMMRVMYKNNKKINGCVGSTILGDKQEVKCDKKKIHILKRSLD